MRNLRLQGSQIEALSYRPDAGLPIAVAPMHLAKMIQRCLQAADFAPITAR